MSTRALRVDHRAPAVPVRGALGVDDGRIIFVLAFETYEFLVEVPVSSFLTGTEWTPLFANQHFGVLRSRRHHARFG